MGSPSAFLFFGYDLGVPDEDQMPDWWLDEEDPDNWKIELLERRGWTWWAPPARKPGQSREQYEAHPAYQHYADHLARRDALLASMPPVDMDRYGWVEDYHSSSWTIRVRESVRDTTTRFEMSKPFVLPQYDPAWPAQLKQFIDQLDLPHPGVEPGWHLTCTVHP